MEHSFEEAATAERRASVGELFSDLMRDFATLVRQEVDLARLELTDKAERAKSGAMKIGVGAGLAVVGVILLAVAAMLGITLILSTWMTPLLAAFIGALLVGLTLAVAAYFLVRRGADEAKHASHVPERTLESLKENAQWAKNQLR
jgi:hypothetical protein